MNNARIIESQPSEQLEFVFEEKKQISSLLRLANSTDQYVAFKVKTTAPQSYCVRPNRGIIKPRSTCSVNVTRQAQKLAPFNLQCNDKFLIQSRIVPLGTTEKEIKHSMFAEDKYSIEETKLRVILTSNVFVKQYNFSYNKLTPEDPKSDVVIKKLKDAKEAKSKLTKDLEVLMKKISATHHKLVEVDRTIEMKERVPLKVTEILRFCLDSGKERCEGIN